MDCLKNNLLSLYTTKLCNQRKMFSHDVETNNKGILHLTLRTKEKGNNVTFLIIYCRPISL